MANITDRLQAIRAGTPMAAPGQANFNVATPYFSGAGGSMGSGFGASLGGDVSVQATGFFIIALLVLVIAGERLGR